MQRLSSATCVSVNVGFVPPQSLTHVDYLCLEQKANTSHILWAGNQVLQRGWTSLFVGRICNQNNCCNYTRKMRLILYFFLLFWQMYRHPEAGKKTKQNKNNSGVNQGRRWVCWSQEEWERGANLGNLFLLQKAPRLDFSPYRCRRRFALEQELSFSLFRLLQTFPRPVHLSGFYIYLHNTYTDTWHRRWEIPSWLSAINNQANINASLTKVSMGERVRVTVERVARAFRVVVKTQTVTWRTHQGLHQETAGKWGLKCK